MHKARFPAEQRETVLRAFESIPAALIRFIFSIKPGQDVIGVLARTFCFIVLNGVTFQRKRDTFQQILQAATSLFSRGAVLPVTEEQTEPRDRSNRRALQWDGTAPPPALPE